MSTIIKINRILREFRLLQFADTILYFYNLLKYKKTNDTFIAHNPGFIPPPSHLAYDAYNHCNWQWYYEMGLNHASMISSLISKFIPEKQIKIFEWGCGPARVIQHLQTLDTFTNVELFGSDYNQDTIKHCSENYPDIHFCLNKLDPPLPFSADFFDCIYAISVFTHLSEKSHHDWIHELLRVLKPNGIIIFTTHGDICSERLLTDEKHEYDSGKLVVIDKIKEGKKHFATYHPPRYIRDILLHDHTILKHISNPVALNFNLGQEVWVVKK